MYKRLLIATDGSELSSKAVSSGLALAESLSAQVVVLNVVPRYPLSYFEGGANVPPEEVARAEKMWADAAQAMLEKVKILADARQVRAEVATVSSDLVADAIIAAAKKHQCDLIIMASHGRRGMKRLLLGSETTQVLTHSHIPVLVLR
jgi:nucleotide-binding universal stress UspA family protein